MDAASREHRRRRSSVTDIGGPQPARAGRSTRSPTLPRASVGELSEEGHKSRQDELPRSGGSSPPTSDHVELEDLLSDGLEDDEETGLASEDRRKRRQQKRRNTLLDARVAGDGKLSKLQQTMASQSVLQKSIINAILIGLWYLFSLSISIYNKWMFSKDHLNFHFPLFTTSMHMLVQFSLASLVLYLLPQFRPRHDSITHPDHGDRSQTLHDDDTKPLMTRLFYVTRIGPCGAATGLDIGLGNMSLKFITLTFYTMCKSSSLAFVLMFAFVFHLESPSIKLVLIIATMTAGVIMMVTGETRFDATGFVLVISAAFFSGFRWALTQILLLRNPATSNPFSSIFYLAPVMFASLLLIALPVEGVPALWAGLGELVAAKGFFSAVAILLFPGMLAFLMTSSEFALLQRTSVVTLSICGIFKEVVTISAAGIVFHDSLTPINISGLLVTMASIAAYNYIKITKMRTDAARVEAQRLAGTEAGYGPVESEDWEGDAATSGANTDGQEPDVTVPSHVTQEPESSSSRASPVKGGRDDDANAKRPSPVGTFPLIL